jgi:hypothetical protein
MSSLAFPPDYASNGVLYLITGHATAPSPHSYPTGSDRGIEFAGVPFQGPRAVMWTSPGTVEVELDGGVTFTDQGTTTSEGACAEPRAAEPNTSA